MVKNGIVSAGHAKRNEVHHPEEGDGLGLETAELR